MKEYDRTRAGKFLCYVLRHQPQAVGIRLDKSGWANINDLLSLCGRQGRLMTRTELREVVAEDDKGRFVVSEDNRFIRAAYGHSTRIDYGYPASEPPRYLFHGTIGPFMPAIRREGLRKMKRTHVHMSDSYDEARKLVAGHGFPFVLRVQSRRMHRKGIRFYQASTGVWLTDGVPPNFIEEGW